MTTPPPTQGMGQPQIREGVIATPPEQGRPLLQHHRHPDGRDQGSQFGGVAQGAISQPFQSHPHQDTDPDGPGQAPRQGHGKRRPPTQQGTHQRKGNQCTDHDQIPMGKVDQFQNPVHQGVPQGNQGIDAPQGQTVEHLLQERHHVRQKRPDLTTSPDR